MIIENAGLILLHPFLNAFFDKCNLLAKNRFKNSSAQQRGVFILQYLATGHNLEREFLINEFAINRILVGLDPFKKEDIAFQELTEREKKECDLLLEAVIKHWSVLKNSSVEWLRKEFLNRRAVLQIENVNPTILMEPLTIDILIKYLPWNVSIVKLEWMKYCLFINW